jgi:hypothetical protein
MVQRLLYDKFGHKSKSIGQKITGVLAGDYEITTTLTNPLYGQSDTYTRTVSVLEAGTLNASISITTKHYFPVGFSGDSPTTI